MPIHTACPGCWTKLEIPERLIGKKVKCSGCGQILRTVANAVGHAVVEPQADCSQSGQCPACGKKAPRDATTCQHCGAILQVACGGRPVGRT